jgi:alkylhydroperoxidase/carboxymuconolactone decarboxylase family protein YurZ
MHVQMALANGVEPESIRELYRHLAPYVGYPILVPAFQRLAELGLPDASDTEAVKPVPLTGPLARAVRVLEDVDPGLAAFSEDQLAQRWARTHLSVRERAIACLVVDVFYQTLGESLRLHAELAKAAGATEETLRDLLRGLAEFGLPRAWAAAKALLPQRGSGSGTATCRRWDVWSLPRSSRWSRGSGWVRSRPVYELPLMRTAFDPAVIAPAALGLVSEQEWV